MRSDILLTGLFAIAVTAAPAPQAKGGNCKKIALVFARGSTETGSMGITVGPALSSALQSKFGAGNVLVQGVSYPASIDGAVSGAINPAAAAGSKDMTKKVKAILSSCPDTKIILSGYSQGAEQVHGALQQSNLGQDGAKIAAAITYGDPMAGERTKFLGGWGCLPESRTLVNCNKGDGVCTGAFSISAAHLSYTSNGDIGKGVSFAYKIISSNEPLKGNADGQCKWAANAADYKGKDAGGAGASAKGAPGATKGKGGGGKGGGGAPPKVGGPPAASSPPTPPSPAASESTAPMAGMEGMDMGM